MVQRMLATALFSLAAAGANASSISFSTFVSGTSIAAVEGQENTIAFTYAGNKFVGSVYYGANNAQLYSTNLTGGNVQLFGSPVPGGTGEIPLAASLGRAGFPAGDIYAGTGDTIYQYANTGGTPMKFAMGFSGTVRGILFDPTGSFGGKMLIATDSGIIYTVTSAGHASVLANVGEFAEGMDIATSAWGPFAGDVLVSSETSGNLRAISPSGTITLVANVPAAETVSFVPLNLGASKQPIEGFYVANFPVDIRYATAGEFSSMLGDAIVTSEEASNAQIWDIHYTGNVGDPFTTSLIGNLPNQSEDGIFVTATRIQEIGIPEPSALLLLATGLACLAAIKRGRRRGNA